MCVCVLHIMQPDSTVPGQEASHGDNRMEEGGIHHSLHAPLPPAKPRLRDTAVTRACPPPVLQTRTISLLEAYGLNCDVNTHTHSHHNTSDHPFYSTHKMKHIKLNCSVYSFTNSRTLLFSIIVLKQDFLSVASTDDLSIANPLTMLINSRLTSASCLSEDVGQGLRF